MQEDTELEKTGPDATQGNLEIKHILLATNYTVIPDLIMADKKLDPLTKLLLGVIIKFIREKGQGRCFPTQKYLSKMLQISRRTINNELNRLKIRGYLDWERKGLPARSFYTLKLPEPLKEEDFDLDTWSLNFGLIRSVTPSCEKFAQLDVKNIVQQVVHTASQQKEEEIKKKNYTYIVNGKGGMGGNQLSLFSSSPSVGNKQHNQPERITTCESERPIPTGDVTGDGNEEDIPAKERELLSLLRLIPGYPFDVWKDLVFIRDLLEDFPNADMLEEIRKWKTWLLDKDFKGKKLNYRSRLRNWIILSYKFKYQGRKRGVGHRKASRARVLDDDPYGDIPTRDIPYGDPRLDNVVDPYEDIPTRDIPL